MTPTPSYQSFPVFGSGAAKVQPVAGTYNGGFLPGQLFPAEYENWLMNNASFNSLANQNALTSVVAELINILTQASISPNIGVSTQVYSALQILFASVTALNAEIARAEAAEALLAPLASPTFTGTVVVPSASGATSPYQKQQVDALIAGTGLVSPYISSSTFSSNTNDILATISIGNFSFFSIVRRNSSGGNLNLNVILPASGTYDYSIFVDSHSTASSGFANPAGASVAGGTNVYTISIPSNTVSLITGYYKRVS